MDAKAGARAALGGKSKGGAKKSLHVHEISIRRAHNGGHIVTHHMRDANGNPPENPADATQENAVPPGGLLDNIQQSGMADDPSQGQDPSAQAAPAAAAGSQ